MRRLLALFLTALSLGCAATLPRVESARSTGEKTPGPVATSVPAEPTPPPVLVAPPPPPPGEVPTDDLQPPLIRVLLQRTSGAVKLPAPGRAWRATAAGGDIWLWGPLEIRAMEGPGGGWQVGAFASRGAAEEAIATIRRVLGPTASPVLIEGEDGLARVRVSWREAAPEDPSGVLRAAGFVDAFAVPGEGSVRIEGAVGEVTSAGEILLEPAGRFPMRVGSHSYRGRLRLRTSGGDLLVINELNMERYLRGVVPGEMGPAVFPELEALKAQTIAARTYAVAHLGDHDDEGYDICDTPACQVYHGVGVEHSLTNRAIDETANLIAVYDGVPIDAMYTSTCGGHTEDSSELFSGRSQPYLQGVPCAWDRALHLRGDGFNGGWKDRTAFSEAIVLRALHLGEGADPRAVVSAVAEAFGRTPPIGRPTGPEALAAALIEAADLERAAEVLTPRTTALDRLLFLSDLYGVVLDPPAAGSGPAWSGAAALAVLQIGGLMVRDEGEAVPRPGGVGIYPRRADASELLATPVPLWERWREGFRQWSGGEILPGTHLERYRFEGETVALVVRRSGGDGEADRRSAWREWIRVKPWSELARRLGMPDLKEIKVLRRSDSGRVVGLAAVGEGGARKEWSGFDVRRALDLPETLFTMNVRTRADGAHEVRFLGRGWGHGVGLCQNGAYGLARSGKTFDQILSHYYSGVAIVQWLP